MGVWTIICGILLLWYVVILFIAYNGVYEILKNYRRKKYMTVDHFEPVTILRPIKGIDPELESCLESSFLQNYPPELIEIIFCVDEATDPSIPIIQKLINTYPNIDAKIYLSTYQEGRSLDHYGPNPKVNNLAKGFLNAKYDILWIMDSNVWGSSNILANSVKCLNDNLIDGGYPNLGCRKVKLVHHVPLALAIAKAQSIWLKTGIKLDELFLFSSHCKFYISVNKLNIAPCVNGKSNMFRRSDVDMAVGKIPYSNNAFFNDEYVKQSAQAITNLGPGNGIKFFAKYIGEDNMIAIGLWEFLFSRTTLTSDLVIQPLNKLENSSHGIVEFVKRRIRWLRVRKYMVHSATMIEPTTESIVCGIFGTLSISHLVYNKVFIVKLFLFHMMVWVFTDFVQYLTLVSNILNDKESKVPNWINFQYDANAYVSWLFVWLQREIFAFPIWLIAICGQEIDWRGRPFRINSDLTAEEL